MMATSGLCSHVKACREASERRKKWESQVRWGAQTSRRRASRKDYKSSREPRQQRRRRDGDCRGWRSLSSCCRTAVRHIYLYATRRAISPRVPPNPDTSPITELQASSWWSGLPTVLTAFFGVAGAPLHYPGNPLTPPVRRPGTSSRRGAIEGPPPEPLSGARKAWRHALAYDMGTRPVQKLDRLPTATNSTPSVGNGSFHFFGHYS